MYSITEVTEKQLVGVAHCKQYHKAIQILIVAKATVTCDCDSHGIWMQAR